MTNHSERLETGTRPVFRPLSGTRKGFAEDALVFPREPAPGLRSRRSGAFPQRSRERLEGVAFRRSRPFREAGTRERTFLGPELFSAMPGLSDPSRAASKTPSRTPHAGGRGAATWGPP